MHPISKHSSKLPGKGLKADLKILEGLGDLLVMVLGGEYASREIMAGSEVVGGDGLALKDGIVSG